MNFDKIDKEEYKKQLKYFNDYYGSPFREGQGTEEILELINKYACNGTLIDFGSGSNIYFWLLAFKNIEKVEIFEAGLDDRSMEMFKLTLFARLHIQDPALQYVYFYRRTHHEQLEFTLVFEQETRGISVSQDLYLEIVDIMEKEAANEVADGFLAIDREWAGQRIKNEIGELSQEDL